MSKKNNKDVYFDGFSAGFGTGILVLVFWLIIFGVFSEQPIRIDKEIANELCTKLVGLPSEHYYDDNVETEFSCKIIEPEKPVQKINIPQIKK